MMQNALRAWSQCDLPLPGVRRATAAFPAPPAARAGQPDAVLAWLLHRTFVNASEVGRRARHRHQAWPWTADLTLVRLTELVAPLPLQLLQAEAEGTVDSLWLDWERRRGAWFPTRADHGSYVRDGQGRPGLAWPECGWPESAAGAIAEDLGFALGALCCLPEDIVGIRFWPQLAVLIAIARRLRDMPVWLYQLTYTAGRRDAGAAGAAMLLDGLLQEAVDDTVEAGMAQVWLRTEVAALTRGRGGAL
jgi:hypothetical protein